jgi:hypothetical protein
MLSMLGIDDLARGWKSTKDSVGYLATGKTRPCIMAMSYGATLINTRLLQSYFRLVVYA